MSKSQQSGGGNSNSYRNSTDGIQNNHQNDKPIFLAELETVLSIQNFEMIFKRPGYYQIRLSATDSKKTNIYGVSNFLDNRVGYDLKDSNANMNTGFSNVFEVNDFGKILIDSNFYINTMLPMNRKDLFAIQNGDIAFCLDFELYYGMLNDPDLMERVEVSKIRISTLRYKYNSYSGFVFFSDMSTISYSCHASLIKVHVKPNFNNHSILTDGPPIPNTEFDISYNSLFYILKIILSTLNSIIFSYEVFVCSLKHEKQASRIEILKDFINLSASYSQKIERMKMKYNQGVLEHQQINTLIEEIPLKIYIIWAKYISDINKTSDSYFLLSILSKNILKSHIRCQLMTRNFSPNEEIYLSSSHLKKLVKNFKSSLLYQNASWLPVHQVDASIVNITVKNDKKISSIIPDLVYDLKKQYEMYVIHEEIAIYPNINDNNNNQAINLKTATLCKNDLIDLDITIDNQTQDLFDFVILNEKASDASKTSVRKMTKKLKDISTSMKKAKSPDSLEDYNPLFLPRVYDEGNDSSSECCNLISKDNTIVEAVKISAMVSLNTFYSRWFRLIFNNKESISQILKLEDLHKHTREAEELYSISKIKKNLQRNYLKSLKLRDFKLKEYKSRPNLIDHNYETDKTDKKKLHAIIMIPGLGGSQLDLLPYSSFVMNVCER